MQTAEANGTSIVLKTKRRKNYRLHSHEWTMVHLKELNMSLKLEPDMQNMNL